MELSVVVNLQIVLFLLIIAGMILKKIGIITAEGKKSITDLLIYFILPCNIFISYLGNISVDLIKSSIQVFGAAFFIQIMSWGLSKILYPKIEERKKVVLRYATICSNAGFIGLPVIEQLYGNEGLFLASVALIPLRIFMWSSGLSCFTKVDGKSTIKKLATHPCIIAVVLGFVVLLTGIKLPEAFIMAIKYCSSCTTSISMLIIGSILADVNFRSLFDKLVLYISGVRLLLIPALSFFILHYVFSMKGIEVQVPVLLAAMPAGSTTAILAAKYDGDSTFAAKCVFITSILSLVTIPVITILF